MTFLQFAFNNVTRNKRLYAAYFLSSMFTVMVFFTFSIFAYHPALSGGNLNHNVQSGMSAAKWLIYVFSFFFVLYSMGSFLKTRKREFGLLMMQGMSPGQLRQLVFVENILIGLGATLGGILLGLVFAKAILLIGENMLGLGQQLNFYLPLQAISITIISFMILFVLISLFISIVLRSGSLIQLIRSNKAAKSEPRASLILSLLVIILLGISYTISLKVDALAAIQLLLPIVIMVSIATYLLFTQLSVYIIRSLKRRKSLFWRKTNMLLLSDLAYRMKDNARTFFLVAIVSTVSFCAIGTLYGFQSLLTQNISKFSAYPISYVAKAEDRAAGQHVQFIQNALTEQQIRAQTLQFKVNQYPVQDQSRSRTIIDVTSYNKAAALLGQSPLQVNESQAFIIAADANSAVTQQLEKQTVYKVNHLSLASQGLIISSAIPGNSAALVVSDQTYHQLGKPDAEQTLYAWQTNASDSQLNQLGKQIYGQLSPYASEYSLSVPMYDLSEMKGQYGFVLFTGLFIGIVFFVSAGSFLYFRLYSDLDEDKQKFQAISKIGLTDRELKRILNRQIALLFFAPIVIAMLHGAVALTTMSNVFDADLNIQSATVLAVFFVIQVIYFLVVRFFYIRQIQSAVR